MKESDITNELVHTIVRDMVYQISRHQLFGSVGQHRGVFISARESRNYLYPFCRLVRKAIRARGVTDVQIVPIDLVTEGYEHKLKINGWNGIVAISLDSYFNEINNPLSGHNSSSEIRENLFFNYM